MGQPLNCAHFVKEGCERTKVRAPYGFTTSALGGDVARIFLLGSTGTIGKATCDALLAQGHDVVCFRRPQTGSQPSAPAPDSPDSPDSPDIAHAPQTPCAPQIRFGDVMREQSIMHDGFCGERFDALISCMASRSGAPDDAWAVDHDAHVAALAAAKRAGVSHFILLSAICVQKPLLAFQNAKLAFEEKLVTSGLKYSIIRPTAFFKSLSGQIKRVQQGKPYLVFGDGNLTACKPISDDDLGRYIADCLTDPARHNRILPIGGPGDAMTPRQQGEQLFALLGQEPKFKCVPIRLLDIIVAILSTIGVMMPAAKKKAELARIGRYYATESMLVWDPQRQVYDRDATPSTGTEKLIDYQAKLISAEVVMDRGEQSVF